jgi:hypothetical protein
MMWINEVKKLQRPLFKRAFLDRMLLRVENWGTCLITHELKTLNACNFFRCIGNIHFDTFYGMVFIFGKSVRQINAQKFDKLSYLYMKPMKVKYFWVEFWLWTPTPSGVSKLFLFRCRCHSLKYQSFSTPARVPLKVIIFAIHGHSAQCLPD